MGGCRCTFRSCTVNTLRYPGMHFFHYPLKHPERLQKWVEYADKPGLLDLPISQAKNKVICALHFRDECFMNYKKDRLIPKAVPTLDRLRNGFVLDYSTSKKPKPIRLPPTTEEHLIPPKGYLPLGLSEECVTEGLSNSLRMIEDDDDIEDQPAKRSRVRVLKTQKILNKDICTVAIAQSSDGDREDDDMTTICLSDDVYDGEEYGFILSKNAENNSHTVDIDEIEFLTPEKEDVENEQPTSNTAHEQAIEEFEIDPNQYKIDWMKKIDEVNAQKSQLELTLTEVREELQEESRKATEAESTIEELKKKLKELEAANLVLKTPVPTKPRSAPGQLTKAQLFNGIRKYLSASMTALVRMEMFGAPDREWKSDEKRVSEDLLRLGEDVYEHFTDEWRLRLPPKKIVEQWVGEAREENEEDL